MIQRWTPGSWRAAEARQLPDYPDPAMLAAVEADLRAAAPLVFADECRALKAELAKVAGGTAFLLQGGDCAESFAEYDPGTVRDTFALIVQMAATLTAASALPVVKVGRIAGQFAKPRSGNSETQGPQTLPSYRGDIINDIRFDADLRTPDPSRMLRAYRQSAATLDLLRGYRRNTTMPGWASPFYTSHEALLLPYEEALTRQDGETGRWFDASAHMLWVGDRTRFEGSAHLEYLRGIDNPLGVKCGPGLDPDAMLRMLDRLNPAREPGRITLITRFGHKGIEAGLPPLIRAIGREGHPVGWSCDPMHGNVVKTDQGIKTRPFEYILSETERFFAIHRAEGSIAGGIHVELTGKDVTECTGGAVAITPEALRDRYHTHCDPRLNPAQSLELASLLADMMTAGQQAGTNATAR